SLDPQVPVPRRRPAGGARRAAERGVGLQRRRDHPHARDPHLPPAPEDREGSDQRGDPDHRSRRLPAAAVMSTQRIYSLPVEITEWKFDGAAELHFNWEYEDGSDDLLALYEKGKQQQ